MKVSPRKKQIASVEPLEQRIAPAALVDVQPAVKNTSILLDADPTTPAPAGLTAGLDGPYLLYVTKGEARVFTQDFNNNGVIDFNEITGISAGDQLRLISFVDIHGDIVTNLNPDGTLTDSDGDASNGRDGQILLNSRIEKIELRSVTDSELSPGQFIPDRIALSSYSIFGNIYAGGGFGATDGGLVIDSSGFVTQQTAFQNSPTVAFNSVTPEIGSIKIGTAASGQAFNFGISGGDDVRGVLKPFLPAKNASGGDIINIGAVDPTTMPFNLGTLQAGDGGYNGRGGDLVNIIISGDSAGGYSLIAGHGGNGATGGRGGNITDWADYGTVSSEIFVKTGDGGVGLVGKGGNGGNLSFAENVAGTAVNIAGRVIIKLGDGGSGLTGGGDGGSQPNGQFNTPEPTVPVGTDFVSSWHQPGNIGQLDSSHVLQGFDFDGDGANDAVYASTQGGNGNQLVVLFGTGGGGWNGSKTLYLNGPATAAITIGDFNGDGHPDIAAASGINSLAGVRVFISQYDSSGAFVGFSDPLFSPLPALGQSVGTIVNDVVSFGGKINDIPIRQSADAIYSLASGDFDGDGIVDIAVIAGQKTFILRGDSDPGPNSGPANPTGYFYSDFGNNFGYLPAAAGGGTFSVAKASALLDGGIDALFTTNEGDDHFTVFQFSAGTFVSAARKLGQVDTDRNVGRISFATANVRELGITDINGDGNADVVALTSAPPAYLVTFRGDGTSVPAPVPPPGVTPPFGNFPVSSGSGDQAGIYLGSNGGGLGMDDSNVYGIRAIHVDNANNSSSESREFAFFVYNGDSTSGGFHVTTVSVSPTNFAAATRVGAARSPDSLTPGDGSIRAFDTFLVTSDPLFSKLQTAGMLEPTHDRLHDLVVSFPLNNASSSVQSIENNSWIFAAGNGGNSISGFGGKGGSIGKTLTLDAATGTLIGSFNIVLPQSPSFEADVQLIAGSGGTGFTRGGAGGAVEGVAVSYALGTTRLTSNASVFGGDGGDSVRGTGGAGGRLASFSLQSASFFAAGSGGDGRIGGRGGSIVGNPFGIDASAGFIARPGLPPDGDLINTYDIVIDAVAGDGGAGMVAGGDGGGISGFTPRFLRSEADVISGGLLYYQAGQGGESVRGAGGRGGSIVDSSPVNTGNFLTGDIYIQAGAGGKGRSGGAGGFISDFTDIATTGISATSFSLLAGNGGDGIAGHGGAGGGVIRCDVSGTGISATLPPSFLGFTVATGRVVAGIGGNSVGSAGGDGGSIDMVRAVATSSSMAAAAGRGGDGLQRGGNGGSITNSEIDSAAPYTDSTGTLFDLQTLIVAGEGGDAYAGPRRSTDPLAPGGANPVAGNGGSIVNVHQSIGGEVNVQLVAGNGGDLINAGSTTDITAKVGKGGSVMHVSVAGRIGDTGDPGDVSTPIKAYNPLYDGNLANDDMAFFVANTIVGNPGHQLNGSDGNVGIVVGAKGRVQDGNKDGLLDPALDIPGSVPNGSLIDVSAQHIMSAVAGNVDRIASIQVLQSVRTTITGGEYGADKDIWGNPTFPGTPFTSVDGHPFAAGQLDYLTDTGFWSPTPVIGGRLVDGAIIAKTTRTLQSDRDFKLG